MCLTSPLGPSCTLKWKKLCSKTPGHSVSYWAGYNCMVSSSLSSIPLSNRSFSSGIQKGKVWHVLGTSVTHGEINAIADPGTMPRWKLRVPFFSCFLCLRGKLLDIQSRLKNPSTYTLVQFGVWFCKIKLTIEFSKSPFEGNNSQRVLNCKLHWVSDLLTALKSICHSVCAFLESRIVFWKANGTIILIQVSLQKSLMTWFSCDFRGECMIAKAAL